MPAKVVPSRKRLREMLMRDPSFRCAQVNALRSDRSIDLQLLVPGHLLEIELVLHFHPSYGGLKGHFLIVSRNRAGFREEELNLARAALRVELDVVRADGRFILENQLRI